MRRPNPWITFVLAIVTVLLITGLAIAWLENLDQEPVDYDQLVLEVKAHEDAMYCAGFAEGIVLVLSINSGPSYEYPTQAEHEAEVQRCIDKAMPDTPFPRGGT